MLLMLLIGLPLQRRKKMNNAALAAAYAAESAAYAAADAAAAARAAWAADRAARAVDRASEAALWVKKYEEAADGKEDQNKVSL